MRAALGRNVLVNMGTVVASLGASLATLPFILSEVGTDGYGTWVIGFTFVAYLTLADNGFGPAIQRWVGVAHGAGSADAARGVLWWALIGYTAIGLAVGAFVALAAPWWVDIFLDDGDERRAQALAMFRLVGLALLITLWVAALQNVLQGLERFTTIAVSSMLGSVAYLTGVFVLLGDGLGLEGLGISLVAQQAVVALVRVVALRDVLLSGPPKPLSRQEARGIVAFANRLQVNALSGLLNSQSDKVVVGVVANARITGEMGIASQLVDAGRLVATAALTPVFSALTVTVGAGDTARLREQFAWMHRTWLFAIGGGTIIALGALEPLLTGWLGAQHDEAVTLGLVLVAANGFGLMTGVALVYLRAIGQPWAEARLGPLILAVNVGLSIPLGLLFGAHGVVTATLVAYLLGSIWFIRTFHALAPEVDRVRLAELARPGAFALIAGAVALGGGLGAEAVLPTGPALAGVVAVAGVAYVLYLAAATGRAPTPAGFRELYAGLRGAPA